MADRLFVYGTLVPGRPNEHVLADLAGQWQAASVRGRLFQQGWGAAAGFPGIVLDERGPEVPGMLFTSNALSAHWQRLDDFEAPGYERRPTTVTLRSGETLQAYIYVLRGHPDTS